MSIKVDSKLLAAAVKGLGITIPIRSARKLEGGGVEVWTRDGAQEWKPPAAPKSASKPRAPRKRKATARKTGGTK